MTAHLDVDPILMGLFFKAFLKMLAEVKGLQSLCLNLPSDYS